MRMKMVLLCLPTALLAAGAFAAGVDLSGNWDIDSSVGGATPIKVHCTLKQAGDVLSGSCTPEMANAQPATLTGKLAGGKAEWSYDVVFRDKPGHVGFKADTVANDGISGTLSLSGTEAPFTAKRAK